nr:hypothetical protein [Veillonella seminalis]
MKIIIRIKRIVDTKAGTELPTPSLTKAGIIDRKDAVDRGSALNCQNNIAFSRDICRYQLHMDILRAQTFHLLDALFQQMYVQNITFPDGKRGSPWQMSTAFTVTHVMDPSYLDMKPQCTAGNILLRNDDLAGHIASSEQFRIHLVNNLIYIF